MKGYDAADGYISRAFDPSTIDSHIVSVVKAAGAVVIVSVLYNHLFPLSEGPGLC